MAFAIMSWSSFNIISNIILRRRTSRCPNLVKGITGCVSNATYHDHSSVFGHRSKAHTDKHEPFKLDPDIIKKRAANGNLLRLVNAFREHGHKRSNLDPLEPRGVTSQGMTSRHLEELDADSYGLSNDSRSYDLNGILNVSHRDGGRNVTDIVDILSRTYCGPMGLEFTHLEEEEREWFAERAEDLVDFKLTKEEKKQIAIEMLKSQAFDNFVATKFATVKRYSGEGCESMMGFFSTVFAKSTQLGVEQVIVCIPHRGRLNLLTTLLKYPPVNMFRKMKGMSEFPDDVVATGDVLSHLTSSVDMDDEGRKLHVTMMPNPSHLEAINPVAVGKTRGRQLTIGDGSYSRAKVAGDGNRVMCLQVHGDAAFEAQGIVMETLALANVPHYTVGGSLHLIVNNQIGFTTPADRGRSSTYCSDIAKMIKAPVIHVNGDFPEHVIKASILAMEYRHRFQKDIFVDLVCFRRWGHNEMDDPTFTNPLMYKAIHNRQSIPDVYAENLVRDGILTKSDVSNIVESHLRFLSSEYNEADTHIPLATHLSGNWTGYVQASPAITTWDTGVDTSILQYVGARSVQVPEGFHVHSHLTKVHIESRLNKLESGRNLDWSTAEAIAIGSLLYQGFNVRIAGQDVGRGTFNHRHAVLVCQRTADQYIPLNNISENQKGFCEVANSILSEEAVLGFEYGMSAENPRHLIIWEAQFGDFFNGAQIIIDTFIASGETKWLVQSGLVMLLPHGYDGAGPEHSSCRIERFLQLCDSKEDGVDGDDVNMQVVNPTTPAQYFHLLRRQMVRNFRKPLIIVAPKLLLRLPAATSDLKDFEMGTTFLPVITDNSVAAENVNSVVFCSGKHYYALNKQKEAMGVNNTAIVRLEALCPFPTDELQQQLKKYHKAKYFIWSQEEPQNMGPWSFVVPRFEKLVGTKLEYSGRRPLATPAVGIGRLHQEEVKHILSHPFQRK